MHEQTTGGLTEHELAALEALRTRRDWTYGGGQPQMMCLGYARYGHLFNEARAEEYKAQYERAYAADAGLTLAEYQFARVIEACDFVDELGA